MIDWRGAAHTLLRRKQKTPPLIGGICVVFFLWAALPSALSYTVCFFSTFKAWLTEIHEYAQKDVVIMLLGNKVSKASFFLHYIKR